MLVSRTPHVSSVNSCLSTTALNQKDEVLLQEHHRSDEGEAPATVQRSSEPPPNIVFTVSTDISVNVASFFRGNQERKSEAVSGWGHRWIDPKVLKLASFSLQGSIVPLSTFLLDFTFMTSYC